MWGRHSCLPCCGAVLPSLWHGIHVLWPGLLTGPTFRRQVSQSAGPTGHSTQFLPHLGATVNQPGDQSVGATAPCGAQRRQIVVANPIEVRATLQQKFGNLLLSAVTRAPKSVGNFIRRRIRRLRRTRRPFLQVLSGKVVLKPCACPKSAGSTRRASIFPGQALPCARAAIR